MIEDTFPNGRPPLERAGVYMTDRETVNKSEKCGIIKNLRVEGSVAGNNYVGGVVGYNDSLSCYVTNCYNTGTKRMPIIYVNIRDFYSFYCRLPLDKRRRKE